MNIPSETVTVVVENAPDLTGAVFGFLGVIVGSLLGLAGIRWQHDAQRAYDVRKLCAAFIHDGEFIRDTYLENANGMATSEVGQFLRSLRAKSGDMARTQRQLELIAPSKVDVAAHRYWMACDEYVGMAASHYQHHAKPIKERFGEANTAWRESRDALIQELKPRPKNDKPAGKFRAWTNRRKAMAFLKSVTKAGD